MKFVRSLLRLFVGSTPRTSKHKTIGQPRKAERTYGYTERLFAIVIVVVVAARLGGYEAKWDMQTYKRNNTLAHLHPIRTHPIPSRQSRKKFQARDQCALTLVRPAVAQLVKVATVTTVLRPPRR